MIYTAPRQGLFAVIILSSFCLHTILLVVSTERQIAENRIQKGERLVSQIISDSSLALTYEDRVSLSVIANRYANESDVNRIVIRDAEKEVLVQTGDAPMQQGSTIEEVATYNKTVIGDVEMTMKSTSKGEIVKMLWLFILGSLIMHFFIWLIYGRVARPTKDQLQALSRDIHEHYFSQYRQADNRQTRQLADSELYQPNDSSAQQQAPTSETNQLADATKEATESTTHPRQKKKSSGLLTGLFGKKATNDSANSTTESATNPEQLQASQSLTKAQNATTSSTVTTDNKQPASNNPLIAKAKTSQPQSADALQTQEIAHTDSLTNDTNSRASLLKNRNISRDLNEILSNQKTNEQSQHPFTIQEDSDDATSSDFNTELAGNTESSSTATEASTDSTLKPAPQQPALLPETVQVQINYIDQFHLLDKLSPESAKPYFNLCSQLLKQASQELFKQPNMTNITLVNQPSFTREGAVVELQNKNGTDQKTLTLAGVMLAELYKMLNEIVYDKHRELGRFAFAVAIGVSQAGRENAMKKLLENKAKEHDVMMLLAKTELANVEQHIHLTRIDKPTNVSERECAYVKMPNPDTLHLLTQVRNKVLKVEE